MPLFLVEKGKTIIRNISCTQPIHSFFEFQTLTTHRFENNGIRETLTGEYPEIWFIGLCVIE